MTVNTNQSKISEVRDQLSLDFADGKYLNVVSSNLGIRRPPFGFSDDTWRALVKVISLQYKQIRTKFEEILAVILGPKVTQCSSFAEPCFAGDKTAVLKGTIQFPQLGTMVIDEGLPTEETIEYCYIDRYTNTVYFNTPLVFNHVALNAEWETGVIGATDTLDVTRTVFDTSGFPSPVTLGSYTVNIGRGTPYEYVDVLTSVAAMPSRLVALTSGAPIDHPGAESSPGTVVTLSPLGTQANVYYLTMQDVEDLQAVDGYLQGQVNNTYTAIAGTTTSVKTGTALPSGSPYSGFTVRFITGALTGQVGYVFSNDNNNFFFYNTLSAAPLAGAKFVILTNFQYIRAIAEDNSVLMRSELPQLLTFSSSTKFSVLKPTTTVSVAQVQVKAGGWDVIQSDPDHVEILLPRELLSNDLRTASYIRETGLSGTSTASAAGTVGDTFTLVASTSLMPLIGVLEHAAGGPVRYAYYNAHAWITEEALIGATQIKVSDTSLFPTAGGTLNINSGTLLAYTVLDPTTLSIAPLTIDVERGMLVREENLIDFAKPITANINIGDSLDWYTFYDSGDLWNVDDVFPGPYLWDFFSEVRKEETVTNNTATTTVSGPTRLSIDRVAGNSVFELDDASSFPLAPPYEVRIGENSGNVETLAVQQISLKQRTYTTTAAAVAIGDTSIQVASLSGPAGPANVFPNAAPYRVAIATGGIPAFEVVEVLGTATAPNRLLLASPTTATHPINADVVLLSDLIRVSPAAGDDHLGSVSSTDRFAFYGSPKQYAAADNVRPIYTDLTLSLAGTDFSPGGGNAVFNFGTTLLSASTDVSALLVAGSSVIQCTDTSAFPTSAYPYVVTLGAGLGPIYEERVHVTNNNVGLNQLTISHVIRASYPAGTVVSFAAGPEENFSYNSIVGSVLSFEPYLVVENTHHLVELLAPTVGTNYPRRNGFDFPLRLPVTLEDRIRFVVDLVRAAGVLVTFISKR